MQMINKETEKKIVDLYLEGKSAKNINNLFGISTSSVFNILKRNGNISRGFKDCNRKYSLDQSYFEKIDREDKAYFLGLVYADGNVNLNNNVFRISLQIKDEHILKSFLTYLKTDKKLKINSRKNVIGQENWQDSANLSIGSKKMCEDLINLGCVPNKSLILKFPTEEQVPSHLIHHFIRGYFDGDGCIHLNKKKLAHFSLIGTSVFLKELQKKIIKNCCVKETKISLKHEKNNNFITSTLQYGGSNNCLKLKDFLYKDSNIFLIRKKEKFDLIKVQSKRNKISKLNCEKVLEIKKLLFLKISIKEVALKYKVHYSTIKSIKMNKTWVDCNILVNGDFNIKDDTDYLV